MGPATRRGRKKRGVVARLLRGGLRLGVGGVVIGMVGLIGGGVYLTTPPGNEFLRVIAQEQADLLIPAGSLELGGLQTNLVSRLVLEDVALTDEAGADIVRIARVEIGFDLRDLHRRHIEVARVQLLAPVVHLDSDADGDLNLLRALGVVDDGSESEPWSGLGIDLGLPRIELLEGELVYRDLREPGPEPTVHLSDLSGRAGVRLAGADVDVNALALRARLQAPLEMPVGVDAELSLRGGDLLLPGVTVWTAESTSCGRPGSCRRWRPRLG